MVKYIFVLMLTFLLVPAICSSEISNPFGQKIPATVTKTETQAQKSTAAAGTLTDALISADKESLEGLIEALKNVKTVNIRFTFPETVNINIRDEREKKESGE